MRPIPTLLMTSLFLVTSFPVAGARALDEGATTLEEGEDPLDELLTAVCTAFCQRCRDAFIATCGSQGAYFCGRVEPTRICVCTFTCLRGGDTAPLPDLARLV